MDWSDLFDYIFHQKHSQPLFFLLALFFSFLITPLIRERALKLGLVDCPSERTEKENSEREKIHTRAIPRLGGIAILISIIITSAIYLAVYGRYSPAGLPRLEFEGIAVGALIIFFVGLLDDVHPLGPRVKLTGQVLAASVAWFMNVRVEFLANPVHYIDHARISTFPLDDIWSYLLTVIWLVAISNAFNLIDGVDGLAVGVSLISAIAIWSIAMSPTLNQPAGAMLAATMAGACLGFLRYNFNPARMFLGDNGAYLLGFTLACISCIGLAKKVTVVIISPILILILAVPLFDICFSICRRAFEKKNIMKPDLGHVHNKLMEAGFSQKQVNYLLYGITFFGGFLGTLLLGTGIMLSYLLISFMVLSIWLFFAFVVNRKHQKGYTTK